MKNPRLIALATAIVAWSCFATGSTAIAAPSSTVVMTGLDNPRGLTFAKTVPSTWRRPGVVEAAPAPCCAAKRCVSATRVR
jgi:hypothetical protein